MAIVADQFNCVVGVDTHARTHTLAIVETTTTRKTDGAVFPTSPAGLNRALAWIDRHAHGRVLVVIEGIGSYGANLARLAADSGLKVVEPFPIPPAWRAGKGKTDELDAELIGRSVIGVEVDRLRVPRASDGVRAALRILLTARDSMNNARTAAGNELTALLRCNNLGVDARRPPSHHQIIQIAAWRQRCEPIDIDTARRESVRLAKQVLALGTELRDNLDRIETLVKASPAACLLDMPGVGPFTAAIIGCVWSHPGRIRNADAFAAIAGVSPLPVSSGNTTRHRLNRGGDRQLNRALHIIAVTRCSHDPETRAYQARQLAKGKPKRHTMRLLKRYIARDVFRTLNRTAQAQLDNT